MGRKGWDVGGSKRVSRREQWRKSSSRNAKPNIPPPHQICLFFFQEGKLYFPAKSIRKWLCRAPLMGYAKLRSPCRAIGRRGGKLERTTRELCMIFFDELIIQKFRRSWNTSLCSETHSLANTQDSLHERQHFLLHSTAGLYVGKQMQESDKAFQQPSTAVTVRDGEWIGGHTKLR